MFGVNSYPSLELKYGLIVFRMPKSSLDGRGTGFIYSNGKCNTDAVTSIDVQIAMQTKTAFTHTHTRTHAHAHAHTLTLIKPAQLV